ncbi:hypothetical protein [Pseudomonas hamedanensis]|uniref:Bacterial Ig-like domain-containing protein n=1 Tax=Pseudomonas hamedanensis TaxID=2745504 RepID=A0A9E6TI32_9PSED|nr:hypothetical protein [Pseudomonas hamedanensis]QXI18454.1 hypothetical protein HU739_005535 [Pseudomonas hamedanensis]
MSTSQSNAIAPSIVTVETASGIQIPNGAEINETRVTITGIAEKEQEVEVFDGSVAKGRVLVDSRGTWTFTLTGLNLGPHSISAKALYGSGVVSPAWLFTVVPKA